MIESKIRKEIKQYLKLNGWYVFHVKQGKYSFKGISDYIACKNSDVLFIEVKTDTGVQTLERTEFEKNISASGCDYVLARSIDDIELYLWYVNIRTNYCENCREITEIYAGMEGFFSETAPEAYQQHIIKQMYDCAKKSLANCKE